MVAVTAMEVMIDLETMGLESNAAIVAIGATKFSVGGDISSTFYTSVDLESGLRAGLSVGASTVMWWLGQKSEAREALLRQPIPLVEALTAFAAWIGDDVAGVWGNGAGFDNVILANAYHALGLRCPWPYGANRCYRTIQALAGHLVDAPDPVGVEHNALDDATYQTHYLQRLLAAIGLTPAEAR